MARSGSVRVNIDADASGMKRGVADAERSLSRLNSVGSKAMKGLSIAAGVTGAAAFTGLAAAVATGTQELLEQEKVSAQTAAAIKSTGGAANVTKRQIEEMSSAIQANTGAQDDAVQSAANMLLTFTNIRNEAGKGKDIFNQATTTALDLSVAFGRDLNDSAILVGKALNAPILGVSALNRVGVQFTKDQKEQIKTLVESGRTLDAQKIILKELNTQVGGSAEALGNTVPGQLMKIRRAWEDISEQLVREFLPIITDVARAVLNNMDKVERVFEGIKVAVRGLVKFVGALFEGDWQKAWNIAADGAGKALSALGALAEKVLIPIGRRLGAAIVRGFLDGVDSSLRSIPGGSAAARLLGLGASGTVDIGRLGLTGVDQRPIYGPPAVRRAGGGFIPGRFDGRDDVPVNLSRGEVVLNPTQQRIIGIDRIVSTLRSTGGVVGGSNFNTGGIVASAMQKARSNLGEAYGKPSRGQSRTGPNTWDCSGYATYVAGVNVGGTTASAYGASSPAKGTEPIVWGFRKSHGGSYRGGYDEHMGVRVGGVWYQTSGGRTAQTGSDGDWQEIRVPAGLANIQDGDGGPIGESARGSGRTLTPLQQVTRLLRATGAFGKVGAKSLLAKSLLSGAPDLSDGSDPGFTARQDRNVSSAGRAARAAARTAGKSPEEVSRAGEEAERNEEIRILRRQVKLAGNDLKRLSKMKADTLKAFQKLGRKRVGSASARRAKQTLMARFRAKLAAVTNEMAEVREEIAQLNERLMEIGETIANEAYEASLEAAAASADSTPAFDSISPDAQAQLDQANARATTAGRSAAISDSTLRTLFGSGSIDPAGGSVNVTINTLHPGDPAITGEIARWIVGAFGGQGSVPASNFTAAA